MTPQDIKTARRALNWTQADLAAKAGSGNPLHPKTVAYWERQATVPDSPPKALRAIQDALRAAMGEAATAPRTALLSAFDALPPQDQVQAALMVTGLAART